MGIWLREDRAVGHSRYSPFSMGIGHAGIGVENRPGISLLGSTLRPISRGSVHTRSADIRQPSRITPNYLSTDHDREISLAMFKKMRALVTASPMAEHVDTEIQPREAVEDDESIMNAGFYYGGTGYHAGGAVAIGSAETDPVDSRLRVRGVENLRVIDVSVMPVMISGNLNAPAMAMAYRAAELILEDNA